MEKRKNKTTNKRNYILLLVSIALIIFSIYLWISRPLETKVLNAEFIVDKNIGVDLNSSELNFGKISPGGSVVRRVIIENNYEFPVKAKIFASRNIINFLYADGEYILTPGEKIYAPINLRVPEGMEFGNYSGKVKFEFRKSSIYAGRKN